MAPTIDADIVLLSRCAGCHREEETQRHSTAVQGSPKQYGHDCF